MSKVVTMDFHVTSECSQECPYCWGPVGFKHPVDTATAVMVLRKMRASGVRRVVFTGGDPLHRADLGELLWAAHDIGLEVALSTTGDQLTEEFLALHAPVIDLITLPLDGSNEEVNSQTKRPGHFDAIMRALALLARYPKVDVKISTTVTRMNLDDVLNIARLVDRWARSVSNRVYFNLFQTFPRSMLPRQWDGLLVSDAEFSRLALNVRALGLRVRVHILTRATLDRIYVMVFPDGSLVVPSGAHYHNLGRFLDIPDVNAALAESDFAAAKHLVHSVKWDKQLASSQQSVFKR
jgi:pyruvate-formate lyase-activating enzyme